MVALYQKLFAQNTTLTIGENTAKKFFITNKLVSENVKPIIGCSSIGEIYEVKKTSDIATTRGVFLAQYTYNYTYTMKIVGILQLF